MRTGFGVIAPAVLFSQGIFGFGGASSSRLSGMSPCQKTHWGLPLVSGLEPLRQQVPRLKLLNDAIDVLDDFPESDDAGVNADKPLEIAGFTADSLDLLNEEVSMKSVKGGQTRVAWTDRLSHLPTVHRALMVSLAERLEPALRQERLTTAGVITVMEKWCESHRGYHNPTHLEQMIEGIEAREELTPQEKNERLIVALMHDATYIVSTQATEKSNEEMSVDDYLSCLDAGAQSNVDIIRAILATQEKRPPADMPENALARDIWAEDYRVPICGTMAQKRAWCEGVRREYLPVFGPAGYYSTQFGRPAFLRGCVNEIDLEIMSLYSDDPTEQQRLLDVFFEETEMLYDELKGELAALAQQDALAPDDKAVLEGILKTWPDFPARS